ncbi:AAA family ATPase [Sinomonas gamaensis]|uniref:AAA family ATPase n=1 Tax=Sinomonas gamaensis TaxID=2565624 RepID=UPI001109581E|nr:chromosome partitioning protein [Sinomonas gamaensis]
MSIPVVAIGSHQDDPLVALESRSGVVAVVRRCEELAELIAACQSGLARVAVVVGATADVTLTLADRLATSGVGLVCLTDDDGERRRLEALGLMTASESADVQHIGAVIADAAQAAGMPTDNSPSPSFSLPGARPSVFAKPVPGEQAPAGDEGKARGQVLAFWGPIGSPGRTTLALNVAAEMAASGRGVTVVDADTYGPSVAAHLGLLDESAGLAQACRLADQGMLTAENLERLAPAVVAGTGELRVLTGITRSDRWAELRAAAFGVVLDGCRALSDVVVVDAGFSVEADEEMAFDTVAPRRNATTLLALEVADRVVAVGAADAIGMPRLVRALNDLERSLPRVTPDVVFNKVRRASLGRFPERSLREAWDRFGPSRPIAALVPFEPETADAALFGGQMLLESAPDSSLRSAIREFACPSRQRNRRSAV